MNPIKTFLAIIVTLLTAVNGTSQTETAENMLRFLPPGQHGSYEELKEFISARPEVYVVTGGPVDGEAIVCYQLAGPFPHQLYPDSLQHRYVSSEGCKNQCMFLAYQDYYYSDKKVAAADLQRIIQLLGLPTVSQYRKELSSMKGIRRKDKKKLMEGYIYKREVFVLADPAQSENLYWKHEVIVSFDSSENDKSFRNPYPFRIAVTIR